MILSIKNKRRKNDVDEFLKYFQDVKVVFRQKLNVILRNTNLFKTRNNNKKVLNHKFSKNETVDYTALVQKKCVQSKDLKVKKEH